MTMPKNAAPDDPLRNRGKSRSRILNAAMKLLASGGRDAITTRAVADAAGVQPPVLYRLFGDKHGLLDAVAEYGFNAYMSQKKLLSPSEDPVQALRTGWDLHIDFGINRPAIYLLMYADPSPGRKSPAAEASFAMLRQHIHKVASAGRLRVSEERAANLFHAAALGTLLTLLAMPQAERDMTLSVMAREAALTAITTEASLHRKAGAAEAAIALRAMLNKAAPFSNAERSMLTEWLDRLAAQ